MTPPYPADTRAKGWRFELDYEQIEQSSTWALAPADVRPWLLMLWFTAWKQVPCGTLPTDHEVVSAMIGMPTRLWSRHAKVLLRGWSEIEGRLYHDTLSARVVEMMSRRRSDSDRKARERAAKLAESSGVTQESRVTPTGPHRDSTVIPAPEPEPTTEKEIPPSGVQGKRSRRCPADFRVEPLVWASMQAECPGVSIARETDRFKDWEFAKARSDWPAAWRTWMRKAFDNLPSKTSAKSFKERDSDNAAARVSEMTGGLLDARREPSNIIEMEAPRVAQIGNH